MAASTTELTAGELISVLNEYDSDTVVRVVLAGLNDDRDALVFHNVTEKQSSRQVAEVTGVDDYLYLTAFALKEDEEYAIV